MGVLRLLLALSVALAHVGGLAGSSMVGGRVAVEGFFLISGFYMGLILDRRYAAVPYRVFIVNRILRIYPLYWIMLAATLAVALAAGRLIGAFGALQPYVVLPDLSIATRAWLIWTNGFLLGHESVLFMRLDLTARDLVLDPLVPISEAATSLMLVPQAWTLSLELVFYLLAPFIVRLRTGWLVATVAASLAVRCFVYVVLGLDRDPWTYRVLPLEMAFFIAGVIAFRLMRDRRAHARWAARRSWPAVLVAAAMWSLTVAFDRLPGGEFIVWAYYVALFVSLPYLFTALGDDPRDRFLGELSYPVYLSHVLIATVVASRIFEDPAGVPIRTILGTLSFSAVLVVFVIGPLDRYRQARLDRARAQRSA